MKRRTALGILGSALAAPLLGPPATARAAPLDLDPSNPDHALLMYRKLAHTTDDSVVYWWAHLDRFGQVDGELIPFWRVHVSALITTRDVGDSGAYEANAISLVSYTDIETGEFLETFRNPLTGAENRVNYFPATPRATLYTRDGPQVKPPPRPGYTIRSSHPLVAVVEGQDVWAMSDDMTRFQPESADAGPLFQVSDLNTYHGRLDDVANPEIASAPATWDFNDILTWPPWLEMGDRPGYYVSRGYGRKVFSFDDMPDETLALVRKRFPDIYKDPEGALAWKD
jgi:hypothetical protein